MTSPYLIGTFLVVLVISAILVIASILIFSIIGVYWSAIAVIMLFMILYYVMWLGNKRKKEFEAQTAQDGDDA